VRAVRIALKSLNVKINSELAPLRGLAGQRVSYRWLGRLALNQDPFWVRWFPTLSPGKRKKAKGWGTERLCWISGKPVVVDFK
jgi:hypothetical protein